MQKENLFHDKFRLLNSQEHNVDIKWSSSSSSEYENTSYNEKFCNLDRNKNRKRKRKKKVSKNVSNLDITFTESNKDNKSNSVHEKSPILATKRIANSTSPILTSRLPPSRGIDTNSPILCSKSVHSKSPILILKTASPNPIKVRKKLSFEKGVKQKSGISNEVQDAVYYLRQEDKNCECRLDEDSSTDNSTKHSNNNTTNIFIKSETTSISESDSSLKIKLMEKVKSFFDSHFSSDNTSQNISDTQTPTDTSKNEDIEILSCRTQTVAQVQPTKVDSSNSDTILTNNTKKSKYKKGGLAYRLNAILKKHNAHLSLWQHERFLAGNSSFVIPKEENVVFQIQKVELKYGCYLLYAVDIDNKKYLILINCKYVNMNINVDSVFKLYEPYKVLDVKDEYKIIINVCKYECINMISQ